LRQPIATLAEMILTARPTKSLGATPAARLVALVTAVAFTAASGPAHAQSDVPLIRDSEIEQLLREYTQPILRVAGLAQQNVRVVIINDRNFNAFVADGRRIFVNAGALMESQTPNQIIGVFAHETGHIAGGHLAKMREQMANASTQSIIATLLGVGALIMGARSGGTAGGLSNAGSALLTGPQTAILRSLLSYVRAQEEQADRAGVKFLNATNQSAKGMYQTFKRFAEQMLYSGVHVDPYVQTHPMPVERVASLEELARSSPYWDKQDSPELQSRHDLMRAKLYGFMERPDTVARRYPANDTSLPARYARAISSYRYANVRDASAQIDSLIQTQPNNPYFYELKGQALLESGHAAAAIAPLRRAVQLAPNPALIQVMLGQALIAANDAKLADEAVSLLRSAMVREPEVPEVYTQLAMAYGRKGDLAQADLASAQAAAARGDMKTARELATRAKTRFAVGTPGWVKADDIVGYKPPAESKF
jgi:predicted Zn-dependent protease